MRTLSETLARALGAVLGVFLTLLVLLAAFETFAWTFFEISFAQISEVSGILLVWFGFLGAAYGVERGYHLRLELVTRRFPPRLRRASARLAAVFVFVFGVLVAGYGNELVRTVQNTLPATGVGASVQYFPATAGGILIALFALEEALFGPKSRDGEEEP